MADHLNPDEEILLQSALQTAFTPVPLPKQSALPENPPAPEEAATEAEATSAAAPAAAQEPESTEEVWKSEYDAHVAEWRRRSAEQRERAERERHKWEEIRRKEREEGRSSRGAASMSESGWESVGGSVSAGASIVIESATSTRAGTDAGGEPSVADARDLVSGEGQGGRSRAELEILPGAYSSTSTPPDADVDTRHRDDKDKWEDIPSSESLASSFPSISFPSDPHSPSSGTHAHALPHPVHPVHLHHPSHPGHSHHPQDLPHPAYPPRAAPSTSLALFDSSLSLRTRALALLASLAVNVALPFVNGVMLGFGEIFAKEVLVGWFGFGRKPTASASSRPGAREAKVGLR